MTSVVIPAHNEESSIARLLAHLAPGARCGELEIVVICNGCTDRSADIARSFGPEIVVSEIEEASKARSLKLGDQLAESFPRVYVDADVLIDVAAINRLVATLERPGVLATAPERILVRSGVSPLAGWYYDVWERLPEVRDGLFGRGVIAVSSAGFDRIRDLPQVMSDDLAVSESFSGDERTITSGADVHVHPAQTWRSLVRRRIRVTIGTQQLKASGLARRSVNTRISDLIVVAQESPRLALKIPVFLATAICIRLAARRRALGGEADVWLRDDSSRVTT